MTKKRYQDYIIKDGKFIGDFEDMYRNCQDPWLQSSKDNISSSRRIIIKNWIKNLDQKKNKSL